MVSKQASLRRRTLVLGGTENLENNLQTLIAAATFAAHKHRDQRRKGADASPYINHPLAVAHVLANEGAVDDVTTLVAALLHDTIEDTQTTADEIAARFGAGTAAVVMEVTDDKRLGKDERKRRQVLHAAEISERAKLVKLADKICNLRDLVSSPPADWPLERRREYFEWSRQVVDQLRSVSPQLAVLFDKAYAGKP
jgi:GTP diphosphokinase / guanosine-3',5'-bis(diphosphate) 3'-diphosphatase